MGRVRLGGRKLKYIINATGGTGTRGIRQPSPVPNGFSGTGTVPGGYPGNSIPVLHLSSRYLTVETRSDASCLHKA